MKNKIKLTECPRCKNDYFLLKKEKCLFCGYDKGFEEAEQAIQDLKDAIYNEFIKIGKWLRNIFMYKVDK